MATVGDLINDALTEINAVTPGQALSAADIQLGLTRGNAFIDSANARTLMLNVTRFDTYTLPSLKQSYTIGIAANAPDIVANYRPNDIIGAAMVDTSSPPIFTQITVVPAELWESYSTLGAGAADPAQLWYQKTYPNGTINLRGIPTNIAFQIRLQTRQLIGQAASISTVFQGPPGWYEAFMYSLAERLCNPFGKTGEIVQRVSAIAAYSRAVYAAASMEETARPLPPSLFTGALMGAKQ